MEPNKFEVGQKIVIVNVDDNEDFARAGLKLGDVVTVESSSPTFTRLAEAPAVFFTSRFQAYEPKVEAPQTLYVGVQGTSLDLCDVDDTLDGYDDGEQVAVYQLVKVGKVSKPAPTVA
jgi:hypothetical protein